MVSNESSMYELTLNMHFVSLYLPVSENTSVQLAWLRGSKKAKTKKRLVNETTPIAVFDEKFQIKTDMELKNADMKPVKEKMSVLQVVSDEFGTLGQCNLDLSLFGEKEYNLLKLPLKKLKLDKQSDEKPYVEVGIMCKKKKSKDSAEGAGAAKTEEQEEDNEGGVTIEKLTVLLDQEKERENTIRRKHKDELDKLETKVEDLKLQLNLSQEKLKKHTRMSSDNKEEVDRLTQECASIKNNLEQKKQDLEESKQLQTEAKDQLKGKVAQAIKVKFEMQALKLEINEEHLVREREIASVAALEDYMFSLDRYDCNYLEDLAEVAW